MADDPATALADLLVSWQNVPASNTPENVRNLGDPATTLPFWEVQARAFDLVREVERAIRFVELRRQTAHYRRHVPAIYAAIGGYTVPFRNTDNSDRVIIDDSAIDALRSLADVLHSMDAVILDSDDLRRKASDAIDAVVDFTTDETVDRQSRAYLQALSAELTQALADINMFGTALVRRVSVELAGVLLGQALNDQAAGNTSRAQKATSIAKQLYLVAASAAITKAIDGGFDGLLGLLPGSSS